MKSYRLKLVKWVLLMFPWFIWLMLDISGLNAFTLFGWGWLNPEVTVLLAVCTLLLYKLFTDQEQLLGQLMSLNTELEIKVQERTRHLKELLQLRDDLTNMVVHDLKNPITSISLVLQSLARGKLTPEKPQCREMLELASSNSDEMLRLTQNLLDITKMEQKKLPLNRTEQHVGMIVNSAITTLRMLATSKRIELHSEITPPELGWQLDGTIFNRILSNLLNNAIKFSPEEKPIRINAAANGDTLTIMVENQGPAIPAEHHEVIFSKFVQRNAPGGDHFHSSGLGLTFCRLAAETHGGSIHVMSPLPGQDNGARFAARKFMKFSG